MWKYPRRLQWLMTRIQIDWRDLWQNEDGSIPLLMELVDDVKLLLVRCEKERGGRRDQVKWDVVLRAG